MVVGLLIAALAWAGPGQRVDEETASKLDVGDAVVLLHQGSTACAGAFIDANGTVATAYHCVADGGRVRVQTRDGRVAHGRTVSRWAARDLAVVAVPSFRGEPHLVLREAPVAPGQRVRAWGHPMGSQLPAGFLTGTLRWAVSEGVVATLGAHAVQITAPVNPGNSGGPVVDEDGRLVGIVSRRLRGDGLGFAARASELAVLLAQPGKGSAWGGSVRSALVGSLLEDADGTVAAGLSVEASLRDRVVVRGQLQRAPQPRFAAARFGGAAWAVAEAHLAIRQRFGHGYWTARLDGYGGVAVVQRVVRVGEVGSFATRTDMSTVPMVGGRVTVGFAGIDVAGVYAGDGQLGLRTALVLNWPGRMWVF